MKKYTVQLTRRARTSITEIINYLEEDQSKTVAQYVRKGIMDKIKKLEYFPKSHEEFHEISTEQKIYYRALQWSYKIVFTVQDDILQVVVVQVYHSSRGDKWIGTQFK